LDSIFKLLPETQSVLTNHPELFLSTVQKNLIIKTSAPNFIGADIWVTFLHEGAGYKNVLGYFIYDLHDNYTIPTKWNGTQWVPMEYSDRNLLNSDGKSSIKKTIIFPNTSFIGSGGNLQIGSKVKICYDPSNPTTQFPNNIGVGFFIIPNGWNGTVNNSNERIYTYQTFNTSGNVQTLILNNSNTNSDQNGSIILSFEDIMRPAGDKDYNDVIFKVTYTPQYAFDTTNVVRLLSSCYSGFSKILCKNKKTGEIGQICVKDIKKEEYEVFSTITNTYVPIYLERCVF
jgi:hypothetical protein